MEYEIQTLDVSDIKEAIEVVETSFMQCVTPTLSGEGIETFLSGLTLESVKKRMTAGSYFAVCKNHNAILGVAALRDGNHLNWLFVHPAFQKRGIGRQLLSHLIAQCESAPMTVNASINAIDAYLKLGFIKDGLEKEANGICHQPMACHIG